MQSGKRQPERRLTVFLIINAFEFYILTGLVRIVKHDYSRMKIITYENIEEAAACLRNGGLVAFPTETVYGLGADAANPQAVTTATSDENKASTEAGIRRVIPEASRPFLFRIYAKHCGSTTDDHQIAS